MKVIFSRKGFDSGYGGQPSPILQDGTMLSLPIPSPGDKVLYSSLIYKDGITYDEIIHRLARYPQIDACPECHLDPDIRKETIERSAGWRPAFGQIDAAQSHLSNQGVGVGDLFLFFGWFRQVERIRHIYRYTGASFHAIFGYMQVGEIITRKEDVPDWLKDHPHACSEERWKRNNALYIGADRLSFNPSLPGAGPLSFHEDLILTRPGASRSVWGLPDFFRDIPITYNANAWKEDGFHSAAKGQEFVFTADERVMDWLSGIIK